MPDSTFQIGGIMSGLDTNALVDAIMALERRPQDKMVEEHGQAIFKQELLQTANANMLVLQGAASSISNESTFGTYDIFSTLDSVATATAGKGAVEGAYELRVHQQAQATKLQSNFFVRGQAGISSGGGLNLGASWGLAGFSSSVDPSRYISINMEDGRSASFSLDQVSRKKRYDSPGAVSSGAGIDLGATWDSAGFGLAPDDTGSISIATSGGVSRTFDLSTMVRSYGATSFVSSAPVSSGSKVDTTKKWDSAGLATVPTDGGNITITMDNGDSESFQIQNNESIEDFLDRVNSSDIVEVTLSYDYNADTFRINSDTGEKFTITEDGATGFFTAMNIDTAPPAVESGYETVQGFMDAVNADAALGVELSYDAVTDTFSLQSLKDETLTLSETGTTGFFESAGFDLDPLDQTSGTVQAFLDTVNASNDVNVRIEYDAATDSFSAFSLDGQLFTMTESGAGGFLDAAGMKASLASQNEVVDGAGTLDLNVSFADAGFFNEPEGLVGINGFTFDLGAYSTVQEFMDAVNTNQYIDVSLSYDDTGDRFNLVSNVAGEILELEESDDGFFTQANITMENVWRTNPSAKLQDAHFREDIQDGSEFRINGVSIVVATGVDTMGSIVQEINQSDAGVTAFFDQERNSLVLTANETGAKSISLTEVSGNFLSAVMLKDSGSDNVGVLEMGQDAKFRLNGAELTTNTNSYKYNGLTFDLKGEGTTVINANLNVDVAVNAVSNFVKAYNDAIGYIKEKLTEKTIFNPGNDEQRKMGLLNSNMSLISIEDSLRGLVGGKVEGLPDGFNDLVDVGISTGPLGSSIERIISGKLSFDEDVFREKFANDQEAVMELFTKITDREENESPIGSINESNKLFTLRKADITPGAYAQVVVDGQALSRVWGTASPGEGEYRIDVSQGTLLLGKAPADSVNITYTHNLEYGPLMGLGSRLQASLKRVTDAGKGILEAEVQSLEDHKIDLVMRIDQIEYQLQLKESRLWEKYSFMEGALAEMEQDSQYLLASINSLQGNSSKKK